MLEIRNLTKKYGQIEIIKGINYTFNDSGIYVINGQNGTGKSTLLKILANQVFKTSGEIRRTGEIAYLPEKFSMPMLITARSYLKSVLCFLTKNQIDDLLAKYSIPNKRICELSKGNIEKLAIAHIFSLRAKIFLLDEIFDGLDGVSIVKVKEELLRMSKENLVILINHNKNLVNDLKPITLELKEGILVEKKKRLSVN